MCTSYWRLGTEKKSSGYCPIFLLSLLTVAMARICGTASAQDWTVTVTINGEDVGREYHGVGAISAAGNARHLIDCPKPERNQILGYLYKLG